MIGCGFAFAAMAFANESVRVVVEFSRSIIDASGVWTPAKALELASILDKLADVDRGKRDGHASRIMGAHFVHAVASHAETWESAVDVFGRIFVHLSCTRTPSFMQVFKDLSRVGDCQSVGEVTYAHGCV